MEKVKSEVGFKGTLPQFFAHLRTDPKYKMPTREALTQGYYDIGKKVDAKLSDYAVGCSRACRLRCKTSTHISEATWVRMLRSE